VTRVISQAEIQIEAGRVARLIIHDPDRRRAFPEKPVALHGIPRGGIVPAYAVAAALNLHGCDAVVVSNWADADYLIDDLVDSGATKARYEKLTGAPFLALFDKERYQDWLVFPWEETELGSKEDIVLRQLQAIGEDVTREGLAETPKRVVKAWGQWFAGYGQNPADVLKVFEDGAEGCDQMVLETDIPVYSFCEHHMAPIFGVAHIAYIPNGKVVGLSKLARVTDIFARRLQVQERLTNQIADALDEHLAPLGVGVIIQARHGCMESRGVCKHGVVTTTSALRGAIRNESSCRAEFMSLVRMSKNPHSAIL
jgi:GTP cyclohydrolase I